MRKPHILLLLSLVLLSACSPRENQLKPGLLKGTIHMQGKELPFLLNGIDTDGDNQINSFTLINGEEELVIDEFSISDGKIEMRLHIFDISLAGEITDNGILGTYTKHYIEDYILPFEASYQEASTLFPKTEQGIEGKYAVEFKQDDQTITPAIGIFWVENGLQRGTFLTETGDYRYLQGFTENDKMSLYTFDGNHAFIFEAEQDSLGGLQGQFLSGKSWKENWTGNADESAELGDAYSLTYLKEGFDTVEFSFSDIEGNMVGPQDSIYQNQVLVLQIFGTWCPNCMDETIFFRDWINNHPDAGVNFLGIAYEAKDDYNYAVKRVKKMKEKLNLPYNIVIGGNSNKEEASKTLPMLNEISSFPTTIFIDKKGKVRSIHTGFNGPATGKYYTQYTERFNQLINQLVSE